MRRLDAALRRELVARFVGGEQCIDVAEVEMLTYPDRSVDVLVDLVDADGRRRVCVPFPASSPWLSPQPDPVAGAFEIWVALGEWGAGARTLASHRLPDDQTGPRRRRGRR